MHEKPFIHLLRSPNSGYFFDVNRNEIVAISNEDYRFLLAVEEGKIDFAAVGKPPTVKALEQQGYLSNNKVKVVKHPYSDRLKDILERNVRKVTIQLTQDCNFRCKYCVYSQLNNTQRHHTNHRISVDTAHKAILFLRDHSIDCDEVNVGFYGGEPLLEFEMLKELTLFAENIMEGKSLTFSVTTNGTLLTDEVVQFFMEHNFDVLLSIDGIKEIHDKNRTFASSNEGTFDTIVKRIEHIRVNYPDFLNRLAANMVIDTQNDFDIINQIFSTSTFQGIRFQTTLIDDDNLDLQNSYSED